MKIGNQVKFKSSVVKRCGSDKNMADLRGEVVGVFGKTVDVKFQDRTRAVPVANLEIDAPIDNGYWSRQ